MYVIDLSLPYTSLSGIDPDLSRWQLALGNWSNVRVDLYLFWLSLEKGEVMPLSLTYDFDR
jgi:hypothetical protein